MPAAPRLAKQEKAVQVMLGNLGLKLGVGSDSGKPLLKRGGIVRVLACGNFPVASLEEPIDVEKVDSQVADKTKRTYVAMVQSMDKNVATILGDLDSLGLRENTILIFASDNGATLDGCNLPLRGGKHTLYEGGVHLPTAIQWPKGGLMGGKKWDGLCGFLDIFPTLMDMAGLKMPETRPLDGKDVWPALREGKSSPVENYYWAWTNCDAIRTADWKMLRFFSHNELYDIRKDLSETTNLAAARPDVVKSLTAKMNAWVASTGAALSHQPANPRFDSKAAPEGQVLELTVTATPRRQAKGPNCRPVRHL